MNHLKNRLQNFKTPPLIILKTLAVLWTALQDLIQKSLQADKILNPDAYPDDSSEESDTDDSSEKSDTDNCMDLQSDNALPSPEYGSDVYMESNSNDFTIVAKNFDEAQHIVKFIHMMDDYIMELY